MYWYPVQLATKGWTGNVGLWRRCFEVIRRILVLVSLTQEMPRRARRGVNFSHVLCPCVLVLGDQRLAEERPKVTHPTIPLLFGYVQSL
jgi:hypothetical protein